LGKNTENLGKLMEIEEILKEKEENYRKMRKTNEK
jgi:hypothetical protein